MVKGLCMKEREQREIKNPKYEMNDIGRAVVRGECAQCGTKMYKIMKVDDAPPEIRAKGGKSGGKSKKSPKSHKSHKSGGKSKGKK